MAGLPTKKQLEILGLVTERIEKEGVAPTQAYLARYFGVTEATMNEHIFHLVEKKLLKKSKRGAISLVKCRKAKLLRECRAAFAAIEANDDFPDGYRTAANALLERIDRLRKPKINLSQN